MEGFDLHASVNLVPRDALLRMAKTKDAAW